MSDSNCRECPFKAKYDANPKSILGKIWRWHINFCPGWKSYIKSLSSDETKEIKKAYNLK